MAYWDYVALVWNPSRASSADTARLMRLKARLEPKRRLVHQAPGVWLFTDADAPIGVHPWRDGALIVGDVFGRDGEIGLGSLEAAASPQASAQALANAAWGRYFAVFPGDPVSVFRDPLGGLECLALRLEGVTVVTSSLADELLDEMTPDLAIDWPCVAGFIADPLRITDQVALSGLAAVRPGALATIGSQAVKAQTIWSPSDYVTSRSGPAPSGEALMALVDRCVAAWSKRYPKILAELSGGLDSAIVGAALTRAPGADVKAWINQFTDAAWGDERRFARAAAEAFDVRLREVHRPAMRISPEDFLALAGQARPTLNGSDIVFDTLLSDLAREVGAEAILTGQAGDVVFYELSTPATAADRLMRLGPGGLSLHLLTAIATWNQVSIWSVLRGALLGWAGFKRAQDIGAPSYATALTRRIARSTAGHYWLQGARRTPPGKAFQILNLAYMQIVFGASRRGEGAALLHPLLSQPVVEACLAVPTDVLAEGGRGRGLVRRVWRGRVPDLILDRRSKGDVTAFYGRALADGLGPIRDFLLDGRLVAQGLVDRERLDARLQVDNLIHEGRYSEIFNLMAVEAWVRRWEARLADRPVGQPMS